MTILILGLALIILIMVIVLCSIHNSDIAKIEVKATSKGIKIKLIKKDKPSAKHKQNRSA